MIEKIVDSSMRLRVDFLFRIVIAIEKSCISDNMMYKNIFISLFWKYDLWQTILYDWAI